MPSPGVSKDGHSGTGRGASLVAQWPVQETQVPSLIQIPQAMEQLNPWTTTTELRL